MEEGEKIPHHDKGKHSVMAPKERKINYFSLYSPAGRTSFSFFLFSPFSHIICLFIWLGRLGQREEKEVGRDEKEESAVGKGRDRRKEIEPDRDKASACHARKGAWVGRLWVPSHDREQKQRRLQTRPGGCSLTDGALWLFIAWEGDICLINEEQSADLASEDLGLRTRRATATANTGA